LYSLQPIGFGTRSAEGLISYIIRLAGAHSVSPRRLIMEEFTKVSPELARYRRRGLFFETNARSINGLHQHSESVSNAIEKLCRLSSARYLTLLSLKALLPFNGVGLITPVPRWCPTCYAEMLEANGEIYQPLVWSFDLYRVCSKHENTMLERCPSCSKLQYVIPRHPLIGFCSHCGSWLGMRPETIRPANDFELWIATALEEIIAELALLRNLATRDRFISQLSLAVDCFTNGSRRQFCREIGLPEQAFGNWFSSKQRPTLPLWLAISYGMSIGPVLFLRGNIKPGSKKVELRILPCKVKPRVERPQLTMVQHQALQAELEAIVKAGDGSVSVTMLADKHQLTRSHLRHLWPNQCRQISCDYRQTAKACSLEQLARKCSVTSETVDTLLNRGIYPSQNIIREALNHIGISFANPAIRDAYKQHLSVRHKC
jgi:hypothetical protein